MKILENEFVHTTINVSLADFGIDTEKVIDTTDEIGGGLFDKLYLPFKDNDKFLSKIDDIVTEIAVANGYYGANDLTLDEVFETFPDIKIIPYKTDFDLEYSANGTAELQVWIEPKNPNDKKYLDESLSCQCLPVELDYDDIKYLLNVLTEAICNRE